VECALIFNVMDELVDFECLLEDRENNQFIAGFYLRERLCWI
jgi:hypothetical protein